MKKRFFVFLLIQSMLVNIIAIPICFATEEVVSNTGNIISQERETSENTIDTNAAMKKSITDYITLLNTFNSAKTSTSVSENVPSLKELNENISQIQSNITITFNSVCTDEVQLNTLADDVNNVLTEQTTILENFYNTNTASLTSEELQAFNNISNILKDNFIFELKSLSTGNMLFDYTSNKLNNFNLSKNNTTTESSATSESAQIGNEEVNNLIISLPNLNENIVDIKTDLLYVYEKIFTDNTKLCELASRINYIFSQNQTVLDTFYATNTTGLTSEELQAFNNIVTILRELSQNSMDWYNATIPTYSGGSSSGGAGGTGIIDYKALARCGNSATEEGFEETSDGVNRRPLSVKNIDYYTTLEEQCSTKGLTEIELNSKDGRSLSYSTSKRYTCECGESTLVKTKYTFEDPKLVYSSSDTETNVSLDVSISPRKCSCGNEIPSSSGKSMKLSAFIRDHGGYEELNLDGNTYYVKEDMLDELNIDESHRILFKPSGDTLTLTTFNPTRIDFYYEVERGVVEGHEETAKYGIYPLYNDVQIANTEGGTSYSINRGQLISEKIFFVCGFCAKCTTCDNSVASTGKTLVDTPNDFVLSRYCAEEHACGFFWYIDNGDDFIPSVEGIDCWNYQRADGSVFCERHKCQDCEKPVIGVNLLDSRADSPSVYQGEEVIFYSNFCVTHFCQATMCVNKRTNINKTQPNKSDGKCHDFPIYCEDHADKCGVCGKNSVSISAYESEPMKGKAVCDSCKNSSIKAKVACSNCGIELAESKCVTYKGSLICYICASKVYTSEGKTLNINGENVTWQMLLDALGQKNQFDFLREIRPHGSLVIGEYIHYLQGKGSPWSNIPYSYGTIASSGCGATSVAICATGLGIDINPGELVLGHRNATGRYLYASKEANAALLDYLGLKQTPTNLSTAINYLKETGKPLIFGCNPGYYTRIGHYIAATGYRVYNGKEQVYISNPASDKKAGWTNVSDLKRRAVDGYYMIDYK